MQLTDERDVENKLVVLLEYDKFPFIKVRHGTVGYDRVWYGMVRYGTVRYGTVQYSTVQYSTVGYGTECVVRD